MESLYPALDAVVAQMHRLSPLVEKTYFKTPLLDPLVDHYSNAIGFEPTLLKYTVCLLVVYPLALVFRALPSATMKHVFSAVVGIAMMQFIYGADWIHSFITAMGTYLLASIVPGRSLPVMVFVFVMGYMSFSHLYRMYVDYMGWHFDFTGTQMVLTMKLTSFAWNYFDGKYDAARIDATYEDKRKANVYAQRKKYAIRKLPSLIEFLGYVYCFTCILAGPAFEYADYAETVDGSRFKVGQKQDGDKKPKAPSSVMHALFRLVFGLVCMVLYLVVGGNFPVRRAGTEEFVNAYGMAARFGFIMLALSGERMKYYFAWKVAEGASVLGGFGFEGYEADGVTAKGWSGVENIDVIGFETACGMSQLTRAWNKRTQGWLERYTYSRTGNSLIATYTVSAAWHGFYPGFFLFFLTVPLLTEVERGIRKKINPLFLDANYDPRKSAWSQFGAMSVKSKAYIIACMIGTMSFINYCVQVFNILTLEGSLRSWGSFYHIPHITLVVAFVLLKFMPTPRDKKGDAKKKD